MKVGGGEILQLSFLSFTHSFWFIQSFFLNETIREKLSSYGLSIIAIQIFSNFLFVVKQIFEASLTQVCINLLIF